MKRIISMLAAAAVVISCEMEINQLPVEPTDDLVTINAVSADTKTVLDGTDVLWENNDQIKVVIEGTQRYEHIFTTTLENTSATAKFKGVLTDEFKSATSLNETGYAIYPSDVEIDLTGYIYHEIPAEQDGYIAPGQNLSYSVINTEDLKNGSADAEFKNLYSLIKVTVPEGITKVTLSSDKPLAGKIPFSFAANAVSINETKWASMDESTKVKEVLLLPDASTLVAGKVYDLVVLPGEHNLTVKMENDIDSFEKTVNMTLAASKYYTLDFTTIFSFSDTEFLASPFGGGIITIPFVTSSPTSDYVVSFDFDGGPEWLSEAVTKGAGVTDGSITLVVADGENNTDDRTAEVTIKEVASNKSVKVSVTQKCVVTDLLKEYLVSYKQYGQPYSGSLTIVRSDDYTKGVYKVTILDNDLYADYESGTLNIYDGKYTRVLNVTNDFNTISADNLSLGYGTYSEFKAILPLGPAVLTAEEEALVGIYNETWTHTKHSPATNAMEISASLEASFGQLMVKFLVTEDGSAYTGYASLEGSELKVQIGGQSHPKLGTQWSPDVVIRLTVNSDGTLTMPTWRDGNYNNLSDYVATKVGTSEPEPENPGAGDDPIAGTWTLTAGEMGISSGFGDAPTSLVGKTMVISGSGENYTIDTIGSAAYSLNVTFDGNILSVSMNVSTLKFVYDSETKTLTQEGEFMNWVNPAIRNIVATKQ